MYSFYDCDTNKGLTEHEAKVALHDGKCLRSIDIKDKNKEMFYSTYVIRTFDQIVEIIYEYNQEQKCYDIADIVIWTFADFDKRYFQE